jgi:parallel beta-helix repeat protein
VAGAVIVSRNEVVGNFIGIDAAGGDIVGNVATGNAEGFHVRGSANVENNTASKNVGGFGFLVFKGFNGRLTRNNIFSNERAGFIGCGVYNQDIVGLNATNNYWGSPDGPDGPTADLSCDSRVAPGTGTTRTQPFATRPFKVKILKP